jgi:hypothetical protein
MKIDSMQRLAILLPLDWIDATDLRCVGQFLVQLRGHRR